LCSSLGIIFVGNMSFIFFAIGLAIAATPDGETCLHLTAISKNVDVAKLLLEMGADVNHRVTHARVSLDLMVVYVLYFVFHYHRVSDF